MALLVSTVQAAETKTVDDKVCKALHSEAETKFKMINFFTYQNGDKIIEFFCRPQRGPARIAVYSSREYHNIIEEIKQLKQEREQKENLKYQQELNKVKSLYQ